MLAVLMVIENPS